MFERHRWSCGLFRWDFDRQDHCSLLTNGIWRFLERSKSLTFVIFFLFSEVESSDEMNSSPTLSQNNGNHQIEDNSTSTIKRTTLGRSDAKRLHRKLKKYQIGEAADDVRLCIMCLRAIMNNQVGEENINSYFFLIESISEWIQLGHSTSISIKLHHFKFAAQKLSVSHQK